MCFTTSAILLLLFFLWFNLWSYGSVYGALLKKGLHEKDKCLVRLADKLWLKVLLADLL